jgi:predicted GIY-YIG superfamily endonuclease
MSDDHFLYVIARKSDDAGLVGPVKVGISNNPKKRLATIQTACPFPVKLVYVFSCPNREIALQMERSFHTTRREKCLYGEWFDYSPREAVSILIIAFHVALRCNLKGDDELIEQSLEFCGVRAAERLLKIEPLRMSE